MPGFEGAEEEGKSKSESGYGQALTVEVIEV